MRLSEWLTDKGYANEFISIALIKGDYSSAGLSQILNDNAREPFGIERILGAYCSPTMQLAAIEWRSYLRASLAEPDYKKIDAITLKLAPGGNRYISAADGPSAEQLARSGQWSDIDRGRLMGSEARLNRDLDEGVLK